MLERAEHLHQEGQRMLEESSQLRRVALELIFEDVTRFGAMLESEVIEVYGLSAIEGLTALRWVQAQDTPLGSVLHASNRGRKKMGLEGAYVPTLDPLLNYLARRRAVQLLSAQGYRLVQLEGLQGQVIRMKDARGRAVIVFARHGGYKSAGLHRAVEALLEEEGRGVRFVAFAEDVNDHVWAEKDIRLELRAFSELLN